MVRRPVEGRGAHSAPLGDVFDVCCPQCVASVRKSGTDKKKQGKGNSRTIWKNTFLIIRSLTNYLYCIPICHKYNNCNSDLI